MPHTVNLIAKVSVSSMRLIYVEFFVKAFISFFFKQPAKKKKSVPVPKQKRGRNATTTQTVATETTSYDLDGLDPVVQDLVEENEQMESLLDPAKDAFDDATVRSIKGEALRLAPDYGIIIPERELQSALGLFPKVSGNGSAVLISD